MRHYSDPLDAIWMDVVDRLGWRVERSEDVYASWDGDRTLSISVPDDFDPDDCLAQMLLHEVCHALVAGTAALGRPDWGMENIDDRDLAQEHACHRLQAALLGPHGLRNMLRPTTDHKPYYLALPADPLVPDPMKPETHEVVRLARAGLRLSAEPQWTAVHEGLRATAALAALVREHSADSIWAESLAPHPTGLPPAAEGFCGGCVWNREGTCLQALTAAHTVIFALAPRPAPRLAAVEGDTAACLHWQGPLDCADCGACCHRGFDAVDVSPGDAVLTRHAELVVHTEWGPQLPRPDGVCVALTAAAPWQCRVYQDRPTNCRELVVGGSACLAARTRAAVGP